MGYRLGAGFDLPPMMFTQDEAKALVASVRMAQVWLDPALAQGAQDALGKILSVLPVDARVAAEALAVYAPPGPAGSCAAHPADLREAAQERRKVFIDYRDLSEKTSERICARWVFLLGQGLDAGRLVRAAHRFPQLPHRPRHLRAPPGRALSRRAGPHAGRYGPAERGPGPRTGLGGLASSGAQRLLDILRQRSRRIGGRIALDHLAVLADQELGEVPLDGLAAQQARRFVRSATGTADRRPGR